MTSRFLAFVLAFIVSSPNCWCCVPHEQSPAKHTCCHKGDPAKQESGSKKKCPCELHQSKRSIVDDRQVQPTLNWTLESSLAWENVPLNLRNHDAVLKSPIPTESPPWRSSPRFYERHCALLL